MQTPKQEGMVCGDLFGLAKSFLMGNCCEGEINLPV